MNRVLGRRGLRLGLAIPWVATAALAVAPRSADAVALYGSSASATLDVVAVSGDFNPRELDNLLFTSSPFDDTDTSGFGNAIALADASATGDDVDRTWDLDSSVFGEAPPMAFALTEAWTDIEIQVSNASLLSTFAILFEFSYHLGVGGTVMFPGAESAKGTSAVQLTSAGSGTLFDLGLVFDPQDGEPGGTMNGDFTFNVILAPGESETFFMSADSDGVAVGPPVPEPSGPLLVAIGLGLLTALRHGPARHPEIRK